MDKHGFTLLTERDMAEVGGTARLWRHRATGAQLLSVTNADENKCFGVSFRTPPTDSTGVAHILEHSVLCGSDKYPVKEPFVELLKGSLQTFLNAFTFPDKTCYPVASANLRDFYNLIDVYIDAVFHPRISEDIFRQEGWHIEAESADSPWAYKGVVYNEMKGVYSSPDSVLAEQSQQALFPDTLYSLDSGGNPERIPDLTYQAFHDFHSRYYHPSNARFFFWGDDPEDERLRLLDIALQGYAARPADSAVPLQPRRDVPRLIEVPYAAAEGEKRALFTVNWLLDERGDVSQALLMEMLEHILEGLPGSPLRKALIGSGLGEDTTGCGLETDLRQMYYSTGLKGVAPGDVQKAELLIFDVLAQLAEEGIDPAAVEAAVNSVEFAYRENNSGRFPRGLAAMIQALSTWLYDGDPLAPLAWEAPLKDIKDRLARGEKVFEQAIRRWFLDNGHRATVVLLPDANLGKVRDEAEAARLAAAQAEAGPEQRAALVEETRRLQEAQTAPDSPEALASIPALGLQDLPLRNAPIPRSESRLPEVCLSHELPTQGIAYATLLLPLEGLPERLTPLLPLFARSLTELGTARRDFTELGAYMAAKTGGVGADTLLGTTREQRRTISYLSLAGKAVYDKIPDLFDIFQEILLEPLRDPAVARERLKQMLLEGKARLEHGLQAAGHTAVSTRLRARFTGAGALAERTGGLNYLASVRGLLEQLDAEPETLLADLEELRGLIVASSGAVFDCTAEAGGLALAQDKARALLAALPQRPANARENREIPPMRDLPEAEAFVAPAQINYVGKAANIYDQGYVYHGSASVILRYLRMGYLWEQVRVRGGAYGAFCMLDRLGGTLVCASYRDPNVDQTLAAYDGMADFLRGFKPDKAQLTQAIVGAVGDLDSYLLPDAKGSQSLARWLTGDTDEIRQQMREEILGTTERHFTQFAEVLAEAARQGAICVLGGPKTEEAAQAHGWAAQRLL
ncbi:insulinase family protein [Desulfovibrio porci]|uniref:insulinase family protein n=1 Tax=Desulfovibrio porci TaxID=2605782 RepID=UPI002A82A4BB|nr:insulinase family protein [Desulfovibrio porci]MDY3810418.1 insulinase family protein [Desulfovibrio porci]